MLPTAGPADHKCLQCPQHVGSCPVPPTAPTAQAALHQQQHTTGVGGLQAVVPSPAQQPGTSAFLAPLADPLGGTPSRPSSPPSLRRPPARSMQADGQAGAGGGEERGLDGPASPKTARIEDAAYLAPFPFSDLPDAAQHLIISLISAKDRLASVSLASKALRQLVEGTTQHAELSAVDSLFLERLSQDGGAAAEAYTFEQRRKLTVKAAARGGVPFLRLLLDAVGVRPSAWDLVAVAKTGQLGAVQLLCELGCELGEENQNHVAVLDAAVSSGSVPLYQWLRSKLPQAAPSDHGLLEAAESGHWPMLQHVLGLVPGSELSPAEWLAAESAFPELPAAAAKGGHTQLMERLLQQYRDDELDENDVRDIPTCAAYGCDLATLKHVLQLYPLEGAVFTIDQQQELVLDAAAWSPTPDWRAKVEHLLQLGWRPCELGTWWRRPPTKGGTQARGAGLRERLRWLVHDKGFSVGELACHAILSAGDEPAALQYMVDTAAERLPEAEELFFAACRYGRPRCAEWLLDNFYEGGPGGGSLPLTADFFALVARSGSVQLLRILRERGCPSDGSAWIGMAEVGCVAGLRWLAERGCPRPVSVWLVAAACRTGFAACSSLLAPCSPGIACS
jgi:hypothetical protein